MQFKLSARFGIILALLALVAGFAALTLSPGSQVASAASPRSGNLHVTKECSQYTLLAGGFCTITSSNLKAIDVGSTVVYAKAFGDPVPGVLDTDVVLQVGPGNTAFGHCYLDPAHQPGRCTFNGGTGKFTHFHASVAVSTQDGVNFGWDGTYSFSPRD